MPLRPCCFVLLMLVTCGVARAGDDDAPQFECRWTHAPITIDGKADEPIWKSAQVIDRFRQAWLREGERPPKAGTTVRLLWDREHLYFLAEMQDVDLYAKVTEHDGKVWTDDAFELFFKPAADKPGYYEFNVNPANTVMDMFLPGRGKGGWDEHRAVGEFDVASAVQLRGTLNNPSDKDAGWTVEGRIPWRSFLRTGGRPNPGERWSFAPCRVDISADPADEELSSAAALKSETKANFHHYEDYATLTFAGPAESAKPQAAYGIDKLAPLTTSTVVGSPDPPKPYRVVNAYPKLKVDYPVVVARQPGGDRMWAVTATGPWGRSKVVRFADEPGVDAFETLLDANVLTYDIEFHPKFEQNGYVYVSRNGPAGVLDRTSQIVRYRVDPKPPYSFDPKSETMIFEWQSGGHDGGALAFAPDGKLFVTTGDGSSDSDKLLSGQDLTRPLAKVLRIDVDHPEPGKQYAVPADNPFVGVPGARPETWAYGLRNPWRIDVDPKTGHVWVGQNGQDHWEQVYLVERGANYGWSVVEGSHAFYPGRRQGPHPISRPIAEHAHAEARSLTGGIVYYGQQFPDLVGAYLYGDYSTGKIWAIRVDAGKNVTFHQEIADTTAQPTSFALNARGELLITDSGGHRICRLERAPAETTPRREFPKTLTASGLFKDVKRHVMADGVIPYSVNAELWSDGAHKERFIAIPHKDAKDLQPDEDRRIGVTKERGWEFPNETVIVKSFALEREAGNPASRRWVETRFFTRQEGEWAGYSYAWNDEQTEATLVGGAGMDQQFAMKDPAAPGGERKVPWRYPSRAECMVCHSHAANFVLGPQTLQMNKSHDYAAVGGPADNQLRTLEHLGLLRVPYGIEVVATLAAAAKVKGLAGDAAAQYAAVHGPQEGQRATPATSPLLTMDPAAIPRLVDPHDPSAPLDARARSYLHGNCAHCHVASGGGNALIEMEFTKAPAETNLFDVVPLHDTFNTPDAKLIAPGDPDRSVLLKRLAARQINGQTGQMPPLATNLPDDAAIKLLKQWIAEMPTSGVTPAAEAGR